MKKIREFSAALLTLALSAGCNLPVAPSTPAQAWIDAPRDGMQLPLQPYTLIFHGSDQAGVARMEVSVDGAVLNTLDNPDSGALLVHLDYSWQPQTSGRHVITVRTQNQSGAWGQPASVTVEILPGPSETPATRPARPITHTPTATPTPSVTPTRTRRLTITPSFTPTIQAVAAVSIQKVSTKLVYFGDSSCGALDVTITARATDPKGIKVVVLFYRFQDGGASNDFQSVSMNPTGAHLYQRTLNPTSLLGTSVPFSRATLQYQVVIQQNDGDTSVRTPVLTDVSVRACRTVPAACPTYTDQVACESHGCNWVSSIPGIVARMECRNP